VLREGFVFAYVVPVLADPCQRALNDSAVRDHPDIDEVVGALDDRMGIDSTVLARVTSRSAHPPLGHISRMIEGPGSQRGQQGQAP